MDHPEANRFPAAVERYLEPEDSVAVAAYVAAVAGRATERSRQHDVSLHTALHAAEGNRLGGLRLHHGARATLNLYIDDAELACDLADAINRVLARHAALRCEKQAPSVFRAA